MAAGGAVPENAPLPPIGFESKNEILAALVELSYVPRCNQTRPPANQQHSLFDSPTANLHTRSVPPKKFVFSRRRPEIAEDLPTPADPAPLFPPHDINLSGPRLESYDHSGATHGTLHIEGAELTRVNLSQTKFGSITLKDVRLSNCDLANLATRGLNLTRVEFHHCRLTGLSAGQADCQQVLFAEGDLRYAQFRLSRFQSAEFDSCNLEEADFQGTDLTGAIFRRCNLHNAEMNRVKLAKADLRGSNVDGLNVFPEGLRGATVDPAQAMVFALLLGIRIE